MRNDLLAWITNMKQIIFFIVDVNYLPGERNCKLNHFFNNSKYPTYQSKILKVLKKHCCRYTFI